MIVPLLITPASPRELDFHKTLCIPRLKQRKRLGGLANRLEEVRMRRNASSPAWLAVHHACCAMFERIASLCRAMFAPLNYGPLATARRVGANHLADRIFPALAGLAAVNLPLAQRLRDEFIALVYDTDALLTRATFDGFAYLATLERSAVIADAIAQAALPLVAATWGNWYKRADWSREAAHAAIAEAHEAMATCQKKMARSKRAF